MAEKNELNANDDSQFESMDLDGISEVLDKNSLADDQEFLNQFTETKEIELDEEQEAETEAVEEEVAETEAVSEEETVEEELDLTTEELDASISEAEQKELDDLNAKLGTDFKDIKSLKDSFKKEETENEAKEIDDSRGLLSYFEGIIEKSPEEIVYIDEITKLRQAGKDYQSEEAKEQIQEKIDLLKENENLEYASRTIVSELKGINEKLREKISSYDNNKKETAAEKVKNKKEAIEKATIDMYGQKDFFGLELPKEAYVNAYKEVSNGNTIKRIENDPRLAVEVQLFLNSRKDLSSLNGSASYSDGIRDTMDIIKGKNPKAHQSVRNNKNSGSGVSSLIADFLG